MLALSRFAQGCGASASNLAMFALVADVYDTSIGRVMGLNELCIGAGFSAGPLFGAVLYGIGGFPLPFVVCSVLLAIISLLTPALSSAEAREVTQAATRSSDASVVARLWEVCTMGLLLPAGLLLLGTVVWGVIDSGFYTVHAAIDLQLDQGVIGLNLAAASAAYACIGPVAGSVADRVGFNVVMVIGGVISAASLLLLGPAGQPACQAIMKLYGIDSLKTLQRWWEFSILILTGLGQAGMLIPALGAMKQHVPNNPTATEACISMFNTFQQAGLIMGPLASSVLGTRFNLGNTVIASVILVYCVVYIMYTSSRRQSAGLVDPLLPTMNNASTPPATPIVLAQISRLRSFSESSGPSPKCGGAQ